MFSPAQGLEARWVFPPQRVSRRRAICFPWRVAQRRLVWCSYPSVRSGRVLFFCLAPGMFIVDMSTLCVPRRRVAIMLHPRVDRMRVV